jgi:TonB family protein
MVNPKDSQRYVWIPPGAFTMGCSQGDTECAADEKPPHTEQVARGFWLGQTEVTQAAYVRVTGGNPSAHKGDTFPVESLAWNHAANYCTAIGGRLPTEAEWEYGARAGVPWARYGSLDDVAWHSGNSSGATHPVATKQANAFGLYDMLGNVWEWVAGNYPGTTDKILRGGSLFMDIRDSRASRRERSAPSAVTQGRGFRCAMDGESPAAESQGPGGLFDSPPELLVKVEPEYSQEGRAAQIRGVVLLHFQIDTSGKAVNVRVLNGLGHGLDEKAVEAVKKWEFKPAMKNGKPVVVESQTEVNFHLL